MTERRRLATNDTDRLMLVFVEPEGWDCWLLPGESVELQAEVESFTEDFELQDNGAGFTVWPSGGMGILAVWQGSQEVECGRQRPVGWP